MMVVLGGRQGFLWVQVQEEEMFYLMMLMLMGVSFGFKLLRVVVGRPGLVGPKVRTRTRGKGNR
jgi:hypothetical protein